MNLVSLLQQSVRAHGDKDCLRYKRGGAYVPITYGQFWQTVLACSAGLRRLGIRKGDKVAILANNCPQWAISDFAILSVGAVVVPIYPTLPADQVAFIVRNADVRLCIAENVQQYEKLRADIPPLLEAAILIHPTNAPSPAATGLPWHAFNDLLDLGNSAPPEAKQPVDIHPDDLATIVHTSGTSGKPKGVMLTHRNIVTNVHACLSVAPVYPDDIGLSYLPLSHIFERTVGQYAALTAGACIAYAESMDAIPTNLREVRPTILVTVPRLLEKVYGKVMDTVEQLPGLLRSPLQRGIRSGATAGVTYRLVDRLVYRKIRSGLGGRMRLIVSGGAALSADVARFLLQAGVTVIEGYGMTEAAPVICVNPPHAIRPGTVGRPVSGVTVRLAEDGELLVKGPNVMAGYYNDDDATGEALAEGWLHTGDIAEIDDGYVRIVDRKKHILVLATGKNVAPAPVEAAIMMSPYVSAAVLIGDGRKYVTCLLSPALAELRPVAEKLNLPPDQPEAWVAHPAIRSLVAKEVEQRIRGFAPFEQPKRALLLADEWSVEAGELTPSLKVRNKVILNKYRRQIDAMYEGVDFIPLQSGVSHADAPASSDSASPMNPSGPTGPVAEVNQNSASRASVRNPHIGRYLAVCLLAILAGGGLAALGSPKLPKQLDILGMVKGIRDNNQKISHENGQIVSSLEHIDQLANSTTTMAAQLQSLSNGVVNDKSMLGNLKHLSQQEVNLSQQFLTLAHQLNRDMSSLAQSSADQSVGIGSMNAAASGISSTLGHVVDVNRQTSADLQTADGKTRIIADEMP